MVDISRREGLAMVAGAAIATCTGCTLPAPAKDMSKQPLKAIAAHKGMRFGSAVCWSDPDADSPSFANPAYASLVERECAIIVPENELKAQVIRPNATTFDFSRFDQLIAWAEARKLIVRGHNLLWNQRERMPPWMESHDYGPMPRAEAARILTDHVHTVCTRYGTRIRDYDVVNEAVNPIDGTFYETALSKALGSTESAMDLAFRTARDAAPHARLVYNDYMSWEPGNDLHRAGVLAALKGFRQRGTPVDALGIQSHLVAQGTDAGAAAGAQTRAWQRFLDEVVGMGYGLLITELDVRDENLPADIPLRDHAVADYARAYLDVMLAYPQLTDILVWGLCDRYTWINAALPRRDGVKSRPCLYDEAFSPKLLRAAVATTLDVANRKG